MSEKVEVTNWPVDSSKERVAFDLLQIIRAGLDYPADEKTVLDTYARCLIAAQGRHRFT